MARTPDLFDSIADLQDLQNFMEALEKRASSQKFRVGQDISRSLAKAGIKIPPALRDAPLVFESDEHGKPHGRRRLTLITPAARPAAVTARIKLVCIVTTIRRRRVRICLECGWLYCVIVIYF